MSRLNDLIEELCPHGVEFKKVGEVIKKYSVKAKNDKSVELVYTISKDLGIIPSLEYWKETTSDKRANYQIYSEDTSNYNIIRKNMFAYNPARLNIGSINCLFDKPDGLLSPMYTIFSIDENIFLPKFFLYFLQTSSTILKINNFTEEGARFRFDFANWNKILIPVPPLPIQKEIVYILDTFTELTAELTAELTLRKKQYEYYRDKLLTFEEYEKR